MQLFNTNEMFEFMPETSILLVSTRQAIMEMGSEPGYKKSIPDLKNNTTATEHNFHWHTHIILDKSDFS